MHKDKKGKVYASLTEVKNKTGDIFALVDEFGEVFITSYNKTRYKISKTDISSLLSEEKEVETEQPQTKKDTRSIEKKKEVKKVQRTKTDEEPEEEKKTIEIEAYNRNNQREIEFINNALQPLVNN